MINTISLMKKLAIIVGILLLLASLIAEFFMHPHPYFDIDGTLFFHAWFGFSVSTFIALLAYFLGKLLNREEDYYD